MEEEAREILSKTRLLLLTQSLAKHVDSVLRDFMIDFVEEHWGDLSGPVHRSDLAYLLARRLARSLDSTFVAELAGTEDPPAGENVHPTRLYIMPPLSGWSKGELMRI